MDGRRLGMSIFGRGAIASVIDLAPLPMAGHRHPLVAALHADGVVRVRVATVALAMSCVSVCILFSRGNGLSWTACCQEPLSQNKCGISQASASLSSRKFRSPSTCDAYSVLMSTWQSNEHAMHSYLPPQLAEVPHMRSLTWPAAPHVPQVWDLTKRSRTAAHTLAPPSPGPQRFKATRLAFCRDGSDGVREPGAAHMAVYWAAADEPSADDAPGSSCVAVYQLSTEAAGATQFDPALLAALPVCNAAPAHTRRSFPFLGWLTCKLGPSESGMASVRAA